MGVSRGFYSNIEAFIRSALQEDIGRGDLFAKCQESNTHAHAHIIAKQEAILAGEPIYRSALSMLWYRLHFLPKRW